MASTLNVRIAYRAHSHLVLWDVISAAGIWEQVGLDPHLRHEKGASDAEAALFSGDVDFLSGNHITPYLRRAEGVPMLYLAQPYRATEDSVVSREPIQSVAELRGRRIADRPLYQADGRDLCHPRGDHILYLERAGVAADEVQWVEDDSRKTQTHIDLVASGAADATFVDPSYESTARALGLSMLHVEPLPMIVGPTITGYAPHLRPNPELGIRLIRALAMGAQRLLDDREGSIQVIERDVLPHMGLSGVEAATRLYTKTVHNLEPRLYPTLEGILNAYKLALYLDVEKVSQMNPLSAWDLHYVQQLEESGFFKELTAAAV